MVSIQSLELLIIDWVYLESIIQQLALLHYFLLVHDCGHITSFTFLAIKGPQIMWQSSLNIQTGLRKFNLRLTYISLLVSGAHLIRSLFH